MAGSPVDELGRFVATTAALVFGEVVGVPGSGCGSGSRSAGWLGLGIVAGEDHCGAPALPHVGRGPGRADNSAWV